MVNISDNVATIETTDVFAMAFSAIVAKTSQMTIDGAHCENQTPHFIASHAHLLAKKAAEKFCQFRQSLLLSIRKVVESAAARGASDNSFELSALRQAFKGGHAVRNEMERLTFRREDRHLRAAID